MKTISLEGLTHAEQYVRDEYGSLVGKTVAEVRPLNRDELDGFGWDDSRTVPFVLWFTDGTYAIPSRDEEGNDAGVLFLPGRIG